MAKKKSPGALLVAKRYAKMTPEQRTAAAKNAAVKRWAKTKEGSGGKAEAVAGVFGGRRSGEQKREGDKEKGSSTVMGGNQLRWRNRIRVAQSLARISLTSAEEYFREANNHFGRQLRRLLAKGEDKSSSYWDEDMGGLTRGDLAAEERMAIEGNQQLTIQFAVILAYSALERFLLEVCIDPANTATGPVVNFPQIVRTLKMIGIDLTKPPVRYHEITRLRVLRNAFVHQAGSVNSENIDKLRPFGYTEGSWITLDAEYFLTACALVRKTWGDIAEYYAKILMSAAP